MRRVRRRILAGTAIGLGGIAATLGMWALAPIREVPVIVELQPLVIEREAPRPPPPAPAPIVEP
ncbi:MAG TPA: hypothetical protein VIU61_06450, partial [Kofleriaceae bacterium]